MTEGIYEFPTKTTNIVDELIELLDNPNPSSH
jgi:hypothetical protein